MKINLSSLNPALKCIINKPNQIITLDANLLIPPNRSRYNRVPIFPFRKFKKSWLDPLFKSFPNLAIHEAVYKEKYSHEVLYVFCSRKELNYFGDYKEVDIFI